MNIVIAQRITLAHHVKGGMEIVADAVSRGLAARGHHVEVLTTAHPLRPPVEVEGSVVTHYLPRSDCRRYTRRWWRDSSRLLATLAAEGRADVVVSHSAGAIGYASHAVRGLGIPLVLVVHTPFRASLYNQWRGARTWRRLARLAYDLAIAPRHGLLWRRSLRLAAAVVAPSEAIARAVATGSDLATGRVTVVPHGVDTARFAPSAEVRRRMRDRWGLSQQAFTGVFASRLVPEKGGDVLLRAVAEVPALHLVIAGDGPHAGALRTRARALGIDGRVRFLGPVAHEEVADCFAAGDVFVLPSLCREGFPLSILEAMASGLPTITTGHGGQASAVEPGRTGLLVPPGDARALAAALSRLEADRALRNRLAVAAREAACARFSAAGMVRGYEAVLLRAVSTGRMAVGGAE